MKACVIFKIDVNENDRFVWFMINNLRPVKSSWCNLSKEQSNYMLTSSLSYDPLSFLNSFSWWRRILYPPQSTHEGWSIKYILILGNLVGINLEILCIWRYWNISSVFRFTGSTECNCWLKLLASLLQLSDGKHEVLTVIWHHTHTRRVWIATNVCSAALAGCESETLRFSNFIYISNFNYID